MGIASMVLGIVSLVISFIPFCGIWAILPAVVGLILGIVEVVLKSKRNEGKGMGIAGVILNPLAIIVAIAWWAAAINSAADFGTDLQQLQQQMQQQMQQQPGNVPSVPVQPQQPMQPMEPMQPAQPQQ